MRESRSPTTTLPIGVLTIIEGASDGFTFLNWVVIAVSNLRSPVHSDPRREVGPSPGPATQLDDLLYRSLVPRLADDGGARQRLTLSKDETTGLP